MMKTKAFEAMTRRQFRTWAKIYDWPLVKNFFFERAYQGALILASQILNKLRTDQATTVLDVACGTGTIITKLARQFPNAQFVGIDFSKEMLVEAQKKTVSIPNLHFQLASVNHLPFKSRQFDLILCTDSFHHFAEPDRSLEEMARVLRPKGRFLLVEPAIETRLQRLIMGIIGTLLETPKQFYRRDDLTRRLKATGSTVTSWSTQGLTHFIISQKRS